MLEPFEREDIDKIGDGRGHGGFGFRQARRAAFLNRAASAARRVSTAAKGGRHGQTFEIRRE